MADEEEAAAVQHELPLTPPADPFPQVADAAPSAPEPWAEQTHHEEEASMPIFTVDFNRRISDPARHFTQAVLLGYERHDPAVHGLREGQHVIVDMPGGELWAQAQATARDDERGRYWYGELVGPVQYYGVYGAPSQQVS